MKIVAMTIVALLTSFLGWAAPLQFNTQSTNNSTIYWYVWTNGSPLRYNCYWTPLTNTDTGTNWSTTTNWVQFADCNTSTTNQNMSKVPTNVWITRVITVVGGETTLADLSNGIPYRYSGYPGLTITNQPSSP